jgi:RNA polymerase sigma-70 factor (ECF subfamily)
MSITKENFLEVLKDHERILFKVSNAYCEDPEDRKDIVQEIIIQLWNAKDRYNPLFKLSTWIYRISLNVAISHYRKTSKRIESAVNMNENIIHITENTSDNEMHDHHLEMLQKFINELDKLNKALILLYLEDYSYLEIAEMLGISETNVATKINRLKKRLKSRFEEEGTY